MGVCIDYLFLCIMLSLWVLFLAHFTLLYHGALRLNVCAQPAPHLLAGPAVITGQESDGYDETILPTDFKQAGQIRDTELNQVLVRPLPQGVTLHALFDSCHSGTALDLPYAAKYDKQGGIGWRRELNMRGTAGKGWVPRVFLW